MKITHIMSGTETEMDLGCLEKTTECTGCLKSKHTLQKLNG